MKKITTNYISNLSICISNLKNSSTDSLGCNSNNNAIINVIFLNWVIVQDNLDNKENITMIGIIIKI